MSKFSIAGLQLSLEQKNNLPKITSEIDNLMRIFPWVEMVVLGELNGYGVDKKHAQEQGGEFESLFCDLARKHSVWIVPGSYFEKYQGKIYNTSPVINPEGEIVARYRKIYPFYPYESGIASGNEFVVFEVPDVGKFGVMICYDQWFPEISRTLTWMGAEVIICPTLTNTIDRTLELNIARTNAALNQCFYFNINTVGEVGLGQSIIVDPKGDVIYQANVAREIMPVQIDLQVVRDVRENGLHGLAQNLKSFRDHPVNFPVYQDRENKGAFGELGKLELPKRFSPNDV